MGFMAEAASSTHASFDPIHDSSSEQGFLHEALLYSGMDDFVERTGAFIRDSIASEEPILVVVGAEKIDALRSAVGPDAEGVTFADMADVGQNPARIIPAWRAFVEEHVLGGRRFRGVG